MTKTRTSFSKPHLFSSHLRKSMKYKKVIQHRKTFRFFECVSYDETLRICSKNENQSLVSP
ncbi:hypothetical protein LEP1GSC036_3130 [Leptospira weilii str. 2006001853]|uniref:Uncharacterized protein n=4 Tax=Leptospira weilii TaxID=28184 RepID=A0A828Z0Q3_9LEPT|nr:hypothetical protein LEP1GSC036_3130 [Leptospira weilii str. 2006001853]EMJ63497.1 hypothetical protein LEP1GSC051_1497 [Leptospira sp. P2653]EMM72450.1 hypothetical protein LEP1GSC038_3310 [Leptospira weilii str. 2006001855]EMN43535.1 hypothetical protein LEP1GSC086_0569 [Leptospira weilii str. LNT 1234]EMN91051.1 hypothetical protein LEP1GSC108_4303 [Leptospira weilii str. UI 13098]EMY13926.1 hypothetical protein LEP1GSC043_2222 [Leptospira weilii str. Ecochallenge]QDK22587.1 hypothetica